MYTIYTDGSCKNNGKENSCGAWAYAIYDENMELIDKNFSAVYNTTNNREELKAVINAIGEIQRIAGEFFNCTIITDSSYIEKCYKEKWYKGWLKNNWKNSQKKPVLNKDLWEELIPYFEDSRFSFLRVKGHADNEYNNFVDELAQTAAEKLRS